MKNRLTLIPPVLAILALAGCSTVRVDQFATFADAGKRYGEAMVTLTEEAGEIAIDADSAILIENRDRLPSEKREETYLAQTRALQGLLAQLDALRRHTRLLERYFDALADLAGSDAPTAIGGETGKLVAALGELHPGLAEASFGDAEVADFIGQAVPLVVAAFKRKALERELRAHSAALERELELQRAVLEALAVDLRADLEAISRVRAHVELARPYVDDKKLPSRWKRDRREVLSTLVSLASADDAAKAARKLKTTFVALVEDRVEPGDFRELFADVHAMIDLVELVDASRGEED